MALLARTCMRSACEHLRDCAAVTRPKHVKFESKTYASVQWSTTAIALRYTGTLQRELAASAGGSRFFVLGSDFLPGGLYPDSVCPALFCFELLPTAGSVSGWCPAGEPNHALSDLSPPPFLPQRHFWKRFSGLWSSANALPALLSCTNVR